LTANRVWRTALLGIAGLTVAVCDPAPARAFAPTTLLELGTLSTGHLTITENAILRVLGSLYGITQPSASVRVAIDMIKAGNTYTDEDQTHSSKHFDGENFVGGHEIIIFERNQVLEFAGSGNLSLARFSLGEALHPLQDFYSHSNWVELGNSAINPMLTSPGETLDDLLAAFEEWRRAQAGPDEDTCRSCDPQPDLAISTCADCTANITTSKLTSGYYGGEDRQPRDGVSKCSHGGALDSGAEVWPAQAGGLLAFRYGINKDGAVCTFSPHLHLHPQAAAVATNATEAFLRQLHQDMGDAQFRQLMGIGPRLNIVLDTTASMEPVILGVRDAVA